MSSDHPELHAQVPAPPPRRLQQLQGKLDRYGEPPDFHLSRDQVHGRDCLPEPKGE